MCLGVASRQAGKGETWITSQNRNYKNRMGQGSIAWLASGPSAAAAALGMAVRDPRPLLEHDRPGPLSAAVAARKRRTNDRSPLAVPN